MSLNFLQQVTIKHNIDLSDEESDVEVIDLDVNMPCPSAPRLRPIKTEVELQIKLNELLTKSIITHRETREGCAGFW